jgi:hypothetical protein
MSSNESALLAREVFRNTVGTMPFADSQKMFGVVAEEQAALGRTRNFTPEQTADASIALTHLFRSYDASNFDKMADLILRMGELSPNNLTSATGQFTYMEPTFKTLNVSDDNAAALYVALSRFGLGAGKGGTNVASLVNAALGPLQQTTHPQAGKAKTLRELGVLDSSETVPSLALIRKLVTERATSSGSSTNKRTIVSGLDQRSSLKRFRARSGTQGARIANLFADPIVSSQLHNIVPLVTNPHGSIGLHQQSRSLRAEPQSAMEQAGKSFQTLAAAVGTVALPAVNKAFGDLSKTMIDAAKWMSSHPAQIKAFSDGMLAAVVNAEKFLQQNGWAFKALGDSAAGALQRLR